MLDRALIRFPVPPPPCLSPALLLTRTSRNNLPHTLSATTTSAKHSNPTQHAHTRAQSKMPKRCKISSLPHALSPHFYPPSHSAPLSPLSSPPDNEWWQQVVLTTPLGDNACNCAVSSLYTNLEHREALQAIVKFLHGLCHRLLPLRTRVAFYRLPTPLTSHFPSPPTSPTCHPCMLVPTLARMHTCTLARMHR